MQHAPLFLPAPRRRRRGQAMVEFALTATLLFLLVVGIIEVSRGILTINMLSNGAREAAHYAADKAMQILASAGYRRGSVVERLLRDARATGIYQGTSEAQRMIIAAAELSRP